MNEYRITDSAGITCNPITAVNEKEARKIFWATCKWAVGDITKIELIRENVPATKAQEREALEKIKAIVATLGPRSYIGTALDGCLVDAEVNIENDFGDSMKARWQDAEKRVAQVVQEAAEIRDKLQQEIREKQQAREEAQAAGLTGRLKRRRTTPISTGTRSWTATTSPTSPSWSRTSWRPSRKRSTPAPAASLRRRSTRRASFSRTRSGITGTPSASWSITRPSPSASSTRRGSKPSRRERRKPWQRQRHRQRRRRTK